jgi:predicted lipid carrier protein YhbT
MPTLPRFTLPTFVRRVVSRLPGYPPALLLTAALDFGVGRAVSRDAVAPLAGRRFALVVRDLGLSVRFEATAQGFRPTRDGAPPDLAVTATLRDFIALALREEDPDTLFFARRLVVEGDTELGLTVKNLLDGIDWHAALAALPFAAPTPR